MTKRELNELLIRINDLGGSADFKARVINGALAGDTRSALNSLIDQNALRGDISSQGQGHQGGNTNTRKYNMDAPITSFSQINDDEFFRSFQNISL